MIARAGERMSKSWGENEQELGREWARAGERMSKSWGENEQSLLGLVRALFRSLL
jgi:hypothetical protein